MTNYEHIRNLSMFELADEILKLGSQRKSAIIAYLMSPHIRPGSIEKGDVYVVFDREILHLTLPKYYPRVGTLGKVLKESATHYVVQWAEGSTSEDDKWEVNKRAVRVLTGAPNE